MWLIAITSGLGCALLFSKSSTRQIRWLPTIASLVLIVATYLMLFDQGTLYATLFVVAVVLTYLGDLYSTWSNHPYLQSANPLARLWEIFRYLGSLRTASSVI